MDFKDTIKQLAEQIQKLKNDVLTEEATKNALDILKKEYPEIDFSGVQENINNLEIY